MKEEWMEGRKGKKKESCNVDLEEVQCRDEDEKMLCEVSKATTKKSHPIISNHTISSN